jgi:hypothetical protein
MMNNSHRVQWVSMPQEKPKQPLNNTSISICRKYVNRYLRYVQVGFNIIKKALYRAFFIEHTQ